MEMARRRALAVVVGLCIAVVIGGLVALMMSDGRTFYEDEAGVARDNDGLLFAVCPGRSIEKLVVRAGSGTEDRVLWTAVSDGETAATRIRPDVQTDGYKISGSTELDGAGEVAISTFTIDGWFPAGMTYLVFDPTDIQQGTILTAAGETLPIDDWMAACPE